MYNREQKLMDMLTVIKLLLIIKKKKCARVPNN